MLSYLTQILFYNKVLNISCNLLNNVLKKWLCVRCHPCDGMTDWDLPLTAQHHGRVSYILVASEKFKI